MSDFDDMQAKNDKITPIDEATPQDRAELNVGGKKSNKKKNIIAVVFVLVALVIIGIGLNVAISNVTAEKVPVEVSEEDKQAAENFAAGNDKSSIDKNNAYFEALRKEKDRKEELAKNRALKAERLAKEKAIEDAKPKKVVTRTTSTPRVKQTVTRSNEAELNNQSQPKATVSRTSDSKDSQPKPRSKNKNELTPRDRKMKGSVTLVARGSGKVSEAPPVFSNSFNASKFENGSVSVRNKGALDFLLIHGTSLPCAIVTQIISDYEGYVTCRLIQDIYSANGATLLAEKGSIVNGTQSVKMEQGIARIFTSWSMVETPLGVSINVDSLGTGRLGASGIDAWVDHHFKERFGGAILLSFVDDAIGALGEKLSENTSVGVDNSTDNASEMAAQALESSINIKPTGYAHIGQRINILVARDIDLSSVYHFIEEE